MRKSILLAAFVIVVLVAIAGLIPAGAYAALPEGVVAHSLAVTTVVGNHIQQARAGSLFAAALQVENAGSQVRDYTAVVEVRDSRGFTVVTDVSKGLLGAKQAATVKRVLSLNETGDYSVRAFSYSVPAFGKGRMSISPVVSSSLAVVDASSRHQAGIYVPLYEYPYLDNPGSMWNTLVRAKADHPSVPFAVTINPWSGPGLWKDPLYEAGASQLRKAGIEHVLGYISTHYARQTSGGTMAELKAMIDTYREWYPDVNGLMMDEVNSSADELSFYRELVGYARERGFGFIVANPGTYIDEGYIGLFDNLMIYEELSLPSVTQLQKNTHFPNYPAEDFSFTARNISSLDPSYVSQIAQYVGLFYITSDVESAYDTNPYNTLPPYFMDLVGMLDLGPQ
ncbi:MAG: spherulation-specific family 4 protein [Nitrososphaera sp.]|jgi:hypothetical protein